MFINHAVKINTAIDWEGGLRYDYASSPTSYCLSPRTRMVYRLNDQTVCKAAFGRFFQPLYEVENEEAGQLVPMRSDHSSLSIERSFAEKIVVKAEGYYKDTRLVNNDYRSDENNLYMYCKGLDCQVKLKETHGVSGWISYSLAKSAAHQFYWWSAIDSIYYLGQTPFTPTHFDQRHTVGAVLGYALFKNTTVTLLWRYGSGLPKWVLDFVGVVNSRQSYDIKDGTFPAYNRMDLRVESKWGYTYCKIGVTAEVINVFNRQNVFPCFLDESDGVQRYYYMLPRLPTLGLVLEF
jgi:hypothetical protein